MELLMERIGPPRVRGEADNRSTMLNTGRETPSRAREQYVAALRALRPFSSSLGLQLYRGRPTAVVTRWLQTDRFDAQKLTDISRTVSVRRSLPTHDDCIVRTRG